MIITKDNHLFLRRTSFYQLNNKSSHLREIVTLGYINKLKHQKILWNSISPFFKKKQLNVPVLNSHSVLSCMKEYATSPVAINKAVLSVSAITLCRPFGMSHPESGFTGSPWDRSTKVQTWTDSILASWCLLYFWLPVGRLWGSKKTWWPSP